MPNLKIMRQYFSQYIGEESQADNPWVKILRKFIVSESSVELDALITPLYSIFLSLDSSSDVNVKKTKKMLLQDSDENFTLVLRFKMLLAAYFLDFFGDSISFDDNFETLEYRNLDWSEDSNLTFPFLELEPIPISFESSVNGNLTQAFSDITDQILNQLKEYLRTSESDTPGFVVLDLSRQGISWLRSIETWRNEFENILSEFEATKVRGFVIAITSLDSTSIQLDFVTRAHERHDVLQFFLSFKEHCKNGLSGNIR